MTEDNLEVQPAPVETVPPTASETPAASTASEVPSSSPSSYNVNTLGYFLDGWADIIEGMGEKAGEVRQNVLQGLKEREMPGIGMIERPGHVSITSNEHRTYMFTSTDPGATTTIYVAKHGKDLYASWRTFIRPVINGVVVWGGLIVAAILGYSTGGTMNMGSLLGISEPTFSLVGWLSATLVAAILIALAVGYAGRIFKGNDLAYFFIEPSVFDAEDITAMSLSVHKSLLRALDSAGIDVSKLRLKRDFKGGRREENV